MERLPNIWISFRANISLNQFFLFIIHSNGMSVKIDTRRKLHSLNLYLVHYQELTQSVYLSVYITKLNNYSTFKYKKNLIIRIISSIKVIRVKIFLINFDRKYLFNQFNVLYLFITQNSIYFKLENKLSFKTYFVSALRDECIFIWHNVHNYLLLY
jgi:hypothetical protein